MDHPPVAIPFSHPNASSQLVSLRAAIAVQQQSLDTTSYLVHLEEYLQSLLQNLQAKTYSYDIPQERQVAKFGSRSSPPLDERISWSVRNEIYMTTIAITLTYLKKAAELTNEIIAQDTDDVNQFNENWKRITSYYKSGISYILYAMELKTTEKESDAIKLNSVLLNIIHKVCQISIQMVILIKFSWINRNAFEYKNEQSKRRTTPRCPRLPSLYCRVESDQELDNSMSLPSEQSFEFTLDYSDWTDYLRPREIEEVLRNVKTKISNRKNDSLLSNLSSVSSLQIDKSAFNEKKSPSSKLILNDLTYLFDQLIKLNLKFTKENNNLKFDTIVNWQDIFVDNKWPTGCAIPVSAIQPFEPFPDTLADHDKHEYAGRGAYY
ncbi:hypothetical protein Cantr_05698 [Candida viswanathii]|uniref:Uncharacterized protein n=1 Tax=Candida viswanathii TaxID=5486 RepID=A0A367XRG0_9ASCO|nr:hypothetical protein Cantr_05698 [Candida viswanathii]